MIQNSSWEKTTIRVAIASNRDRQTIYGIRHAVYAEELAQHPTNDAKILTDALDQFNIYIVAVINDQIVGFVSITPPGRRIYSIDKYLAREQLPFKVDGSLYEVRLLTVKKPYRNHKIAYLLMYTANRWVQAQGGQRVMILGRQEILNMYLRVGLQTAGRQIKAGAVTYELMSGSVTKVQKRLTKIISDLDLRKFIDWQMGISFMQPEASCFHGGASFKAIGEGFSTFDKIKDIINADVLDAWFPPSPEVVAALQEYLPWIIKSSPPVDCQGLRESIAQARGVRSECILPGAGSSHLIYLAFRQWLTPAARVLLIDPTYGEYAHILQYLIGCTVDRLLLSAQTNFSLDLSRLHASFDLNYDLIVLVNPNNPTGQHVPRTDLQNVLKHAPPGTRIWIDETYHEYIGNDQSLEKFAAKSRNVIVSKSMSKVYALSGVRVAYLCASPALLKELRTFTPPWSVSLPGQIAAVKALEDPVYYEKRYEETRRLRSQLEADLKHLNKFAIVPGSANFLLCRLPCTGSTAAAIVRKCKNHGLFLRDVSSMGTAIGPYAFRMAVKDTRTNGKMIEILKRVFADWSFE